jgi:hypothetical protein
VTEIREVYITPPAALLECEASPEIPPDDILMTWTQRQAAQNYVLTWRAGEDCRQALTAIRLYLRDAQKLNQEETP